MGNSLEERLRLERLIKPTLMEIFLMPSFFFFFYIHSQFNAHNYLLWADSTASHIVQMRTLRLREVKWLVHDCLVRDRKWNPGVHMLKAMFPLIPMENVEYLLWIHFLRLQKSKGTGVHAVTQIFFFLKNLFIYFNWRTVTSQHCGGPCHTSTRIN